jgi:hypothetical protein
MEYHGYFVGFSHGFAIDPINAWRGQDFGGIEGGPAETEVTWMTWMTWGRGDA